MHVRIPLRDGVYLNATLYKPYKATAPLPIVFKLSPYPDDFYDPADPTLAEHVYIYAYVDVRGRGDSEGSFSTH